MALGKAEFGQREIVEESRKLKEIWNRFYAETREKFGEGVGLLSLMQLAAVEIH